jgi:ATP-binding cassette subfamily F protein 2
VRSAGFDGQSANTVKTAEGEFSEVSMGKKQELRKAKKEESNGKKKENAKAPEEGKKSLVENVSVAYAASAKDDTGLRSIIVENLTIICYGTEIVQEAQLKLHCGQRYGLLGPNGCGKSTLMKCIAAGEIAVNPTIDFYYVDKEVEASEMSALECVLSVDKEKERLEEEAEYLQDHADTPEAEDRLQEIYERIDELEKELPEARAGRILNGLGFNKQMQAKKCKDYSGGWRMRIALAQGLFINPTFLLLDEPSNHLDIEAVVWLEEYLKKFKGILLVISHSQDFLNNVCHNIIRMHQKQLQYFKGNYDSYIQARMEKEENQMKRYQWEQDQIKNMKEYIARFGHGSAKLARQAQSKEKTLAKMVRGGLTDKVAEEKNLSFYFPDPGKLNGSILQFQDVSFAYPGGKHLYKKLNFGIDLDSRVALVGPNGAGKTTLQKLMAGLLEPTDGMISRNGHLRMVRFAQHFVDALPFELHPIAYMQKEFPELREVTEVRSILGRFGCTGKCQLQPIGTLSEGQKARVLFAWMAYKSPHILLLDEPTNALDMETIDSLAEAINDFEGGVVLVSHDIRLIAQVAEDIWICENNEVTPFKGDISDYKDYIRNRIEEAGEAYAK